MAILEFLHNIVETFDRYFEKVVSTAFIQIGCTMYSTN